MPLVIRLLIAVPLVCAVLWLSGCKKKQTVKTGTEEQIKHKLPGPPDKKTK